MQPAADHRQPGRAARDLEEYRSEDECDRNPGDQSGINEVQRRTRRAGRRSRELIWVRRARRLHADADAGLRRRRRVGRTLPGRR